MLILANLLRHSQRIHQNRINMRAPLLIRNLNDILNNVRLQPKLRYPVSHSRSIAQGVHEQDRALREGLHLREDALHGGLRDL